MAATEWIDRILFFYDDSWRVMAFVYGFTWSLSICKKVFRGV